MKTFLDALNEGPLLFDGAMGSLLYERGIFLTRCYDELNISQPETIRQVHRDYLEAGANIIESNTFGANRIALARHGHSENREEINREGVKLAKSVAEGAAYVAGSMGPTGMRFALATEEDRRIGIEALLEQARWLVDEGVDVLVLETFHSILELETAVKAVKHQHPDVPLVAQLVFDADGKAEGVLSASEVADRLVTAGADVVGANCGFGPPELYEVGAEMVGRGAPVSVQPNAGFPSEVEGRKIYVANPEHFGVFARRMLKTGVRVVGGCCGTTPEHVRRMLGAVRMMGGVRPQEAPASVKAPRDDGKTAPEAVVPLEERSRLGRRIARGEFAVSVELGAPAGTDPAKFLKAVHTLIEGGVDICNIADGPRATARVSNLSICAHAHHETGIEPILHVCSRDRNYLGLVSHLLGAHVEGIRDLVIITGDPPKMGDFPFATPVFDVDSIGLLEIAAALNHGIDPAGKEIKGHTSFVLATGAEPAAQDYERELRRLELKKKAGAELVMTQPVYDPRTLERFLDDAESIGLPIMVGLLPLASHRNAEFLHTQVPGMQIPDEYRRRMAMVDSGPPARAEGIKIAQEALESVKHRVQGAYIMPPFNRADSALKILEVVRDRWEPAKAPTPGKELT